MRRSWTFGAVGVAGAMLLTSACQTATPVHSVAVVGANDETPITGAIAILSVNGMSCPLCANNIGKQLGRLDGVGKVTVDLGAGAVRVELAGAKRPSPKQLADAIHNSGFTLTGIETK